MIRSSQEADVAGTFASDDIVTALKAAAEKKAASYEDRRIDMDSFGRL